MFSEPIARRSFLLGVLPLLAAQTPAPGNGAVVNGILRHRGFTMDVTFIEKAPNRAAIEAAMRHQLDIVADCGAKPEILAFFRSQKMALIKPAGKGGKFSPERGVELEADAPPPENPVVLHELVHAMHFHLLPNRYNNPDIERFYQIALRNQLYPKGSYVLTNRNEFFAVTGSLYLWGKVAKPPHDRETLRAKQPVYYEWLGKLFGVKK